MPVKTAERQAGLLDHKTRDFLIRQQTQTVNAIRARLAEFGIVVAKGIHNVDRLLAAAKDASEAEIAAGPWKVARGHADDITEADARTALQQLDQLWDELLSAEQAPIVALLVERVDIGADGLNSRLRVDGLAREMLAGDIKAAA